ncbi:hypothetical protein [Achromobacter insolitus]|nr:hypothetical protein [Achromobacter insolitus]MCP1404313.1 hypothetical protein [Achromobacter insolitus]CAB3737897.1 hypothetical protein LMG6003_05428 [Achromobacter insolitus]VEG69849.1 Uncharacterised protein [Achromobacter insolitus]
MQYGTRKSSRLGDLPNRHLSPRIRAFVDAMSEALPPHLPWEKAMGL